jgi:hypothetical protein
MEEDAERMLGVKKLENKINIPLNSPPLVPNCCPLLLLPFPQSHHCNSTILNTNAHCHLLQLLPLLPNAIFAALVSPPPCRCQLPPPPPPSSVVERRQVPSSAVALPSHSHCLTPSSMSTATAIAVIYCCCLLQLFIAATVAVPQQ